MGVAALEPQQAKFLQVQTEKVSKSDPRPVIQLDVFHQLHCLDSVRKHAYGTNRWDVDKDPTEGRHLGKLESNTL